MVALNDVQDCTKLIIYIFTLPYLFTNLYIRVYINNIVYWLMTNNLLSRRQHYQKHVKDMGRFSIKDHLKCQCLAFACALVDIYYGAAKTHEQSQRN